MAKGFRGAPGMPGGMNMNNLMKQAQKMQQQMEEAQASLAERELEVTSGGGAVKVKINGKKEVLEINISPDVVDPDDIEMLQDLVLTAVNEAIRQIEELANNEMGRITGGAGAGLGGLF
ncbi:MAG: YbaB/EbfC family nucleoid-associated protein [Lachnospirales bacterium]